MNLRPPLIFLKMLALFLASGIVTGCVHDQQTVRDGARREQPGGSRNVTSRIERAFYREAPNCAIIMPVRFMRASETGPKEENATASKPQEGGPPSGKYRYGRAETRPAHAVQLEETLARHLSSRFDRVVGPRHRAVIARRAGLDVNDPRDAAQLSRIAGCPYLLFAWQSSNAGVYAMFWAQLKVGLQAELVVARTHDQLWQAEHVADRSDGGIPLSPISAVISAYHANKLSSDHEEVVSLIEDASRRMVATIPDMRTFSNPRQSPPGRNRINKKF